MEEWNLILMCRECHSLQHRVGWVNFCQVYVNAAKVIREKGWEWIEIPGGTMKLWNEKVRG